MSKYIKKFTIKSSFIQKSFTYNFKIADMQYLEKEKSDESAVLIMKKIDSNTADFQWGRFRFEKEIEDEAVIKIYAFASNEDEIYNNGAPLGIDDFLIDPKNSLEDKLQLFKHMDCLRFEGVQDILLYEQTGQFLWIMIKVIGGKKVRIGEFKLICPGDNFYKTFPEIYHRNGEFLHRYLSIFSSMYMDLQDIIDKFDTYIDVDKAPPNMLPFLAKWMGFAFDINFLEEDQLRKLVKIGFELVKNKGTKDCIKQIVKLFVDKPAFIVEGREISSRNIDDKDIIMKGLYSDNPYDFTVLIHCEPDEKLHARIMLLLNYFKPIRTRVNIIFLGNGCAIDAHNYLDINSTILEFETGAFDTKTTFNGLYIMK